MGLVAGICMKTASVKGRVALWVLQSGSLLRVSGQKHIQQSLHIWQERTQGISGLMGQLQRSNRFAVNVNMFQYETTYGVLVCVSFLPLGNRWLIWILFSIQSVASKHACLYSSEKNIVPSCQTVVGSGQYVSVSDHSGGDIHRNLVCRRRENRENEWEEALNIRAVISEMVK